MRRRIALLAIVGLISAAGGPLLVAEASAASIPSYAYTSEQPIGEEESGVAVDTVTHKVYALSNGDLSSGSTLTVIDETTQQVVDQIAVPAHAIGLAVDEQRDLVYVNDSSGIDIVDGSTDQVGSRIEVPADGLVAVDGSADMIYVTDGSSLHVIDGATHAVTATTALMEQNYGLAGGLVVDQTRHRVFVAEFSGSSGAYVGEYDGSSGALVVNVGLGSALPSLAVDDATGLVYIAGMNFCVMIFDPTNNGLTCGPTPGRSSAQPREVAVDSATHMVYILSDDNLSYLSIADASSSAGSDSQAVGWGEGLVVDSTNGELFAGISHGTDYSAIPGGYVMTLSTAPLPTLDRMIGGAYLNSGRSLVAPHNGFHLDMQTDGNLVVYNAAGTALWNSHTFVPGSYAVMQPDGNLVVYSGERLGEPLWNSGTPGHPGSDLVMQADGNLVVYQGSRALFNTLADQPPPPAAIDVTPSADYTLASGAELDPGASLTHAGYTATMQTDGNFVLYQGTHALWWSHTGVPGSVLKVQADGNMVIYAPAGYPVWSSNSSSASGSRNSLLLQLDGNLVLYRPNGSAAWHRLDDTGSLIAPPPPPTAQFTLTAPGTLGSGDQLVYNGYRATMQADGNFVVYSGTTALWNSRTFVAGSHLTLQADGNVVIYAPAGDAVWTTYSSGVSRLVMQADGNLVAYRADGSVAWHRLHDTSVRLSTPTS